MVSQTWWDSASLKARKMMCATWRAASLVKHHDPQTQCPDTVEVVAWVSGIWAVHANGGSAVVVHVPSGITVVRETPSFAQHLLIIRLGCSAVAIEQVIRVKRPG